MVRSPGEAPQQPGDQHGNEMVPTLADHIKVAINVTQRIIDQLVARTAKGPKIPAIPMLAS